MEAPSTFLPRLKQLDEYTAPGLHAAIAKLVVLYLPEVRGTTALDEDVEIIQVDAFERSFAIRWLTGFVARGAEWAESGPEDEEPDLSTPHIAISDELSSQLLVIDSYSFRTLALDRATSLLAACAGTSAAGALSRTFEFPTSDHSSPITITLRDESLSVGDHTAVGLQTWGSACVLAERIAKDPPSFGFDSRATSRVLELGAGTGLLSLLAGKISVRDQERGGAGHTVIATDYHPAVMENLRTNAKNNFSNESSVEVHPLDWSLYTTGKATTELSRAPSIAVTPIGTPRTEDSSKIIEPTPISGLESLTSTLPTPSISFSVTLSPPSPQTPKTPQTSRSPPPNLARAVFSRLMARGVKFDMPVEKCLKTTAEDDESVLCEAEKQQQYQADSEPNNPTRLLADDGLSPSVSLTSEETDSEFSRSAPLTASEELLCHEPCLERLNGGQSTTTRGERSMDTRQGYLDTSNNLADANVSDADGPTDVASFSTASPSLSDRDRDHSAGRIEKPGGISVLSSAGMEGAGFAKIGMGETRLGDESDIGPVTQKALACDPTGNSTADLPFSPRAPPFHKPFDIIFGADVIYELSHAKLVNDVVQRLLRKPSYAPSLPPAYFHLIMPLRPTHADEANSVDRTFPRAEDILQRDGADEVLAIIHSETYARSAGVGRADEVQYVYYRMAWV
ncbi:hypothetical protein RhiLY_10264 [Ceratobasidium sp. AG-Ba]|nr:hypothetical protein RhiLY_10264 [Ceratobasidium sp. AG-Ba]